MTLGLKIRSARNARGMTQVELSTALGLTPQAVSAIERNDTKNVTGDRLAQLADVLDVDIGWLADDSDDRPLVIRREGFALPASTRATIAFEEAILAALGNQPIIARGIAAIARQVLEVRSTDTMGSRADEAIRIIVRAAVSQYLDQERLGRELIPLSPVPGDDRRRRT